MPAPRKNQLHDSRARGRVDNTGKAPPEPREEPANVPPPAKDWHPEAAYWYASLADSYPAKYFEPVDWALARVAAGQLSRLLYSEKPSAMALQTVLGVMTDLGSTVKARQATGMSAVYEEGKLPSVAELKKLLGIEDD
jgi:hypothetical protein